MDLDEVTYYRADFEVTSNLNQAARKKFWSEFDRLINQFDNQKIKMKPLPVISHIKNKESKEEQKE